MTVNPGFKLFFWGVLLMMSFHYLTEWDHFADTAATTFFSLLFISFLYALTAGFISESRHFNKLLASGFKADHVLKGGNRIAFDTNQKKIAFIYTDQALVYDFGDIKDIRTTGTNAEILQFTTNDINRPTLEVSMQARGHADSSYEKALMILGWK